MVEETRLVAGTWQMARVVSHGATTRSREAQIGPSRAQYRRSLEVDDVMGRLHERALYPLLAYIPHPKILFLP